MYGEDVELFKRMIEKEHLSLFLIPKAHIGHVHSHISDSDKKNQIDSYGRFGGQVRLLKNNQYYSNFLRNAHFINILQKKLFQ